jgi:hypothetical protein
MLLPKEYREERGEEVLGAFLDGAEERGGTRRWPDPREVLSLAALALRVRAGADAAVEATRKAEIVRLIALCGAFYLSVNGIGWLVGTEVWLGGLFKPTYVGGSRAPFHASVVQTVHMEGQALWVAVYVALAAGMWRTGRVLAVVGACFSLATTVLPAFALWDTPLMVVAAVAACMAPARRLSRGQRSTRLAATLPLL